MTRKDYEALAGALAKARPPYPTGECITSTEAAAQLVWERTCRAIGDVLEADNPRFDRVRFVKACLHTAAGCHTLQDSKRKDG